MAALCEAKVSYVVDMHCGSLPAFSPAGNLIAGS